jgi:hypothetical protein
MANVGIVRANVVSGGAMRGRGSGKPVEKSIQFT